MDDSPPPAADPDPADPSGDAPDAPRDQAHKPIPLWLGIGILAALLFGGAALILKFLRPPAAPPKAAHFVVPPPGGPKVVNSSPGAHDGQPDFDPAAIAREADLPDGFYARPGGNVLVKAGEAYARIRPAGTDRAAAAPDVRLGFFTVSELDWEHGYLSQAARRLLADEAYAKELGADAAQVERLRDLPPAPPTGWPDAARQRLADLYQQWQATTGEGRAKAGQAALDALRDQAAKKRSADQSAMTARVARIKATLTPEQVEKINPIKPWEVKR